MNTEKSMIQRIEALPEARKNTILETLWLMGKFGYFDNDGIETLVKASEQVEMEGSKPANRVDEHKLPELPSWVPPLPAGYVQLGLGGTFKAPHGFVGVYLWAGESSWSEERELSGDGILSFYAAPRESEIAKLNYPWLADETAKREDPYEQEQRDDEADNTPNSDRDTVLVEGIGTMLRSQARTLTEYPFNQRALREAYEKAANGPAYKEAK